MPFSEGLKNSGGNFGQGNFGFLSRGEVFIKYRQIWDDLFYHIA